MESPPKKTQNNLLWAHNITTYRTCEVMHNNTVPFFSNYLEGEATCLLALLSQIWNDLIYYVCRCSVTGNHVLLIIIMCGYQQEHLFFVMEYLNGGDLMFHIQDKGRFDLYRATWVTCTIFSPKSYTDFRLTAAILNKD